MSLSGLRDFDRDWMAKETRNKYGNFNMTQKTMTWKITVDFMCACDNVTLTSRRNSHVNNDMRRNSPQEIKKIEGSIRYRDLHMME